MRVDMTPDVFLTLCALVKDAMLDESDATPVLQRAAQELAQAFNALQAVPEILEPHTHTISHLADAPSTADSTPDQAVA